MGKDCVLAGAVAALAALLCGLAAPVASSDITTPMSVQWVFSMGPDATNLTMPVVREDRVYVSRNDILHCLDGATGGQQWQFKPENGGVTTGPVAFGDLIIVGGNDSALYGLNAASGAVVWKVGCSGPIAPTPIVVNDLLMLAANQMVYAVDPRTGAVSWICAMNAPAAYGPATDEAGSMIFFVGQDGSVQCVDATAGRYRWAALLVTGPRFSPPVVAAGRVIVASGKRVYGVARSGGIAYAAEMPAGVGAPTVVEDRLYVPSVDGSIYILSARSGAVVERKTPYNVEHALTSSPVVTDAYVVVGSADGLVFAFDRATGAGKWIYRCRAPDQLPNEGANYGIYAPLMVTDGGLLCLTGSGDLYRFSASAPDGSGPVFGDFEPEPGSARPGGDYVGAVCSIVDDGSGVDPSSIQMTVDGSPVATTFETTTGKASSRAAPLPDGAHVVTVSAKDYRGNGASKEWSFVTDVTIVPEQQPGAPGQPGMPTRPGTQTVRGRQATPRAR
jgi:outer membrane protein assembly factor BamB